MHWGTRQVWIGEYTAQLIDQEVLLRLCCRALFKGEPWNLQGGFPLRLYSYLER